MSHKGQASVWDHVESRRGKPDACGLASAYLREIAEKGDDCSDTTSFFALFVIKTVGEWECLTSASGDASALGGTSSEGDPGLGSAEIREAYMLAAGGWKRGERR